MTIAELLDRLSTYPLDAHVIGHVEHETDRAGILVAWPDIATGAIRHVFIDTPIASPLSARAPKKISGRKS